MFPGPRDAGIDRVQVQLAVVLDVTADHGALEEVDVVQVLGDPGRVVKIARGRVAVFLGEGIDHVNGRACSSVVDPVGQKFQVVFVVPAKERDIAGGPGQHVFDQRAREPETAIIALGRARGGHRRDARGRGLGQADGFQRVSRAAW